MNRPADAMEGKTVVHRRQRYRLGRKIGAGHSSIVYECSDDWGRALAAKVISPPDAASATRLEAIWRREGKRLVALRHPNIVYLHAAFEAGGRFFMIQEKCAGSVKRFAAGPVANREALLPGMARDLLSALQYIHDAGFVHRDIHPQNVLVAGRDLRSAPRLKIGDLGLCAPVKELETRDDVTVADWIRPPEFYDAGRFGRVGPALDVFHAALLLAGFLGGMPPRFGQAEVFDEAPVRWARGLSSRYATALSNALRARVAERTPTALELWRALAAVQGFSPSPSRRARRPAPP